MTYASMAEGASMRRLSYENDEESEGYDYEDEIVEAEDGDSSDLAWHLDFEESVYDESIIRIIRAHTDWSSKSYGKFRFQLFTLVLVICANFLLQVLIISRVKIINDVASMKTSEKLFGPPLGDTGVCYQREKSIFPDFLPAAGAGPGEFTWDCTPMLPMLLSNTSWLDANNDGFWSAADNITTTGQANEKKFGKAGNLRRLFNRLMDEIRDGEFDASKDLDEAQRKLQTKDLTAIPIAWMKAEQHIFKMCLNVDRELCGSLESRGVLKLHIPGTFDTPGDRVNVCRKLYGRCDNLFGELHRCYSDFASQICGLRMSSWDYENRVILNAYSTAKLYERNRGPFSLSNMFTASFSLGSITDRPYLIFECLMLVIWWLAILDEIRKVVKWITVIVIIPSEQSLVETDSKDDSTISITSLSCKLKAVILTFIMIPRFACSVALAYIGSDFLLGSDDYGTLILNGVALAFILEIDEMLFHALAGQNAKEFVANAKVDCVYKFSIPCLNDLINLPAPPFGLVFVASMVAFQMQRAFLSPTGKFAMASAYSCLCHAAGPDCLAAQLLGGSFSVGQNALASSDALSN